MQYSHNDIEAALADGLIKIDPYDEEMLQPASLDLRLGAGFMEPEEAWFSLKNRAMPYREMNVLNGYTLHPGGFVLATTLETVTLSQYIAAKFEGKSSLGRLGMMTHITAGFIDPGFSGQITLEIHNVGPGHIVLEHGDKIGQLVFTELKTPASDPYGSARWRSRYQGQTGPTGARA